MRKILIFAGTTEGRLLAEFAGSLEADVLVSVATEYGKICLDECENVRALVGRMDEKEMEAFLSREQVDLVIDATHPFAVIVTQNIRNACASSGTEYIRCLRAKCEEKTVDELEGMICVNSVEQAAEYLKMTEGNILIATGSKELSKYTVIPNYQERCFARVLSTEKSVMDSIRLGFEGKHLIAMQGPFSEEMNLATLRHVNAKYFVTKESGKAGGFPEKVHSARKAGAVLVTVGRPEEDGLSFEQVCEEMLRRFKKKSV
ncbi:MAG: precorrin-6A reductase [Bariatricus sp.]|nr:precorrin-6A reductase [Bariatricus sp.]